MASSTSPGTLSAFQRSFCTGRIILPRHGLLRERNRRRRQHAPRPARARRAGRGNPGPAAGEGRVPQPRRVGEGQARREDDRGGGEGGAPQARRDRRRANQREHGGRAGDRGGGQGLPLHLRDAGQGQQGEAGLPEGPRRRGRRDPEPAAGGPRELLLGRGAAGARDPRRHQAGPVREPGQPPLSLRDDGAGGVGADGRTRHALRRRDGHLRHHHRCRTLPEGDEPGRKDSRRGPRGIHLLRPGEHPPVRGRGSRRGLLPWQPRPRGGGPGDPGRRPRVFPDDETADARGGPVRRWLVRYGGRSGGQGGQGAARERRGRGAAARHRAQLRLEGLRRRVGPRQLGRHARRT